MLKFQAQLLSSQVWNWTMPGWFTLHGRRIQVCPTPVKWVRLFWLCLWSWGRKSKAKGENEEVVGNSHFKNTWLPWWFPRKQAHLIIKVEPYELEVLIQAVTRSNAAQNYSLAVWASLSFWTHSHQPSSTSLLLMLP